MAKILIVDDEQNIRLMLRLALGADGHQVSVAADGESALEIFGEDAGFDLTLLDQRLPGLQGIEVLRALKKRAPGAKIVMATAFGTIDLARDAMAAGAAGFLRKPFTTEVLRAVVASVLAGENGQAPQNQSGESAASAERGFEGTRGFDGVSGFESARGFDGVSVNGFRLESLDAAANDSKNGSKIASIARHEFEIHAPALAPVRCRVELPPFFIELVKAQCDQENLAGDRDFWRWLGEESLANYLWQNAAPPPGGVLVVDELTSNLKRWIDAVTAA